MSKWTLIRHGESTANSANQLSGWQDVPLTTKGKEQAKQAGLALCNQKIDLVVSSDLQRAVHTAQIAMKVWSEQTKTPFPTLYQDPIFRERNFQHLQGKDKTILKKQGKMDLLKKWDSAPLGIETYQQLTQRAVQGLKKWSKYENCLLFAHGGVIRVLIAYALNIEKDKIGLIKVHNAKPVFIGKLQLF